MPLPFLPVLVISLVGTAAYQHSKKDKETSKGVMTPQRQYLFEEAINDYRDPDKIRKLAKVFRDNGLPGPAVLLEKRAALRELPPAIAEKRRETFRKGMASTNPEAVNHLANVFESQGAIGAANALRIYARSIPPVTPDVTPAPAEPVTPAPVSPVVAAPMPEPPPTPEVAAAIAATDPDVHQAVHDVEVIHGESE